MIKNIMQAINLADLDGLDSVEVSMKDLLALRDEINLGNAMLEGLKKRNTILVAQLSLCQLEKPISLSGYLDERV